LGCEGLREGTQDRREQAQRDTKKWRAKPREAEQSMRGTVQWLNRRGTWQAKDMKISPMDLTSTCAASRARIEFVLGSV